jgi:ABC-2 type transport system ATP-binding protein
MRRAVAGAFLESSSPTTPGASMPHATTSRLSELDSPQHLDDVAAAVAVTDLRKTYPGGVEAVRGITFDVAPGEVFGLLGPNGAGKSTIIGMLTTTIRPSAGEARLSGIDVAGDPIRARASSSVVFQDPVVDRSLSGDRNLDIHGRLWGVPSSQARQRKRDLAERLGIADLLARPVASYSGGQRRRLEIARALLSDPQILFLDEPTVGLDPRIRHELLDVIGDLRRRGEMTIVLTTHYLDEAERLCDRIAIMHEGRIAALDSPEALLASLGPEIAELRIAGDPDVALEALRREGLAGGDSFVVGASVIVPLHDRGGAELIGALERLAVRTVATGLRPPTLDDVYLRLTGDRLGG